MVGHREVELFVDGAPILGVCSGEDGNDPFQLIDQRSDLLAGHALVGAQPPQPQLSGFAFQFHFLDPAADDVGVGAGLKGSPVAIEFAVALSNLPSDYQLLTVVVSVGPADRSQ